MGLEQGVLHASLDFEEEEPLKGERHCRNPLPREAGSQFHKTVIPGEPNDVGRDPESRKLLENRIILDPGSRPAARALAGMTNYDTASHGGG